jgi:hypothetical protein
MALAKYLDSNGSQSVPAYKEYLGTVQFADLPNETVTFIQARPDHFNPGVLDSNGDPLPTEYNMYVNDNLYAQVGQERMHQAMQHTRPQCGYGRTRPQSKAQSYRSRQVPM